MARQREVRPVMPRLASRFVAAAVLLLWSCSEGAPRLAAVTQGRLAPCPSSPNCVSTESEDAAHHVDPIPYGGPPDEARARLTTVIASMPRARVVSSGGDSLHAEFTSRIFRFIDDLDAVFDDAAAVIRLRSASRVGYSDFGVNRSRVEELRRRFQETSPPPPKQWDPIG